eukprot:8783465-Alexandrium_andersonii.AAC.1
MEGRLGLQAGMWALVADAAGPTPRAEATLHEVKWAGIRALRLLPREGLELHGWTPFRGGGAVPPASVLAHTGPAGGAAEQAPDPWLE